MKKIHMRLHQLQVLISYLICYTIHIFLFNKKQNIWLISERGNEARDNGYAFYQYLKTYHQSQKVLYVITKNSSDIEKIAREDRLIKGSLKHYFMYMNAQVLISTHIMGYSPNMRLFTKLNKIAIFKPRGKQVFLQHGIINNYLKEITSNKVDIDLFISGAYKEYNYLLKNFGYTKETVKCTGLARFDNLIDNSKNQILVMPTWRKYLFNISIEKFQESNYCKQFNKLINDKKLHSFLEKTNTYLYFYQHYEIQKYITAFKTTSKRVIIATKEDYDIQELLKNSSVLVTDYSSVFYDFAYMNKPIIYYQFDYKDFYSKHYNQGYFDFEQDGFGPVAYDHKKIIEQIINSYNNKNQSKFTKRSSEFFGYNDRNNCKRIFNEIKKII